MRASVESKHRGLPLSAKARRTKEAPISYLIAMAMRDPGLINLAAGLVDPLTLPVEACKQITNRILSDSGRGRAALQYDTTLGLAELRREALRRIEKLEEQPAGSRGFTADQIVVTTGSQQALYLIGDVLIDPGDIVIAARPELSSSSPARCGFAGRDDPERADGRRRHGRRGGRATSGDARA